MARQNRDGDCHCCRGRAVVLPCPGRTARTESGVGSRARGRTACHGRWRRHLHSDNRTPNWHACGVHARHGGVERALAVDARQRRRRRFSRDRDRPSSLRIRPHGSSVYWTRSVFSAPFSSVIRSVADRRSRRRSAGRIGSKRWSSRILPSISTRRRTVVVPSRPSWRSGRSAMRSFRRRPRIRA
jgi:hypothetical protein